MKVVNYLRSGGTLESLTENRAIKTSRGKQHPNLVLLKYNQIDSPMADPIVQECRGLILDEADNWRVVSRSFDKFFNHGEGHAAPIDWSTAQVQEKLDGSLCVLYYYAGQWRVQTSGTPDASGQVGDLPKTFADLFWDVFCDCGYRLPSAREAEDFCFSFELMTKWNRIIVIHEQPRLTLLACRNRVTGQEHPLSGVGVEWEKVRTFPLQSFDDVIATFSTMEPLKQEGYVVVDGDFNRVKVKHPGYVAIHHLKDGYSMRRLVEIVQAGEVGEFLTYFPEWRQEFTDIADRMAALTSELEMAYSQIKDIPVQKDFALEAVRTRCPGALFSLRAGKTPSIRAFLGDMTTEGLMKTIGIKDAQ